MVYESLLHSKQMDKDKRIEKSWLIASEPTQVFLLLFRNRNPSTHNTTKAGRTTRTKKHALNVFFFVDPKSPLLNSKASKIVQLDRSDLREKTST